MPSRSPLNGQPFTEMLRSGRRRFGFGFGFGFRIFFAFRIDHPHYWVLLAPKFFEKILKSIPVVCCKLRCIQQLVNSIFVDISVFLSRAVCRPIRNDCRLIITRYRCRGIEGRKVQDLVGWIIRGEDFPFLWVEYNYLRRLDFAASLLDLRWIFVVRHIVGPPKFYRAIASQPSNRQQKGGEATNVVLPILALAQDMVLLCDDVRQWVRQHLDGRARDSVYIYSPTNQLGYHEPLGSQKGHTPEGSTSSTALARELGEDSVRSVRQGQPIRRPVALFRQPSTRPLTAAPQVTGAWKKHQTRTSAESVATIAGPAALLIHAAISSAAAITPHHCPKPPSRRFLDLAPDVAISVMLAGGTTLRAGS